MGICCCKIAMEEPELAPPVPPSGTTSRSMSISVSTSTSSSASNPTRVRLPAHLTPEFVDGLIVEILKLIALFIENETQTPVSLTKLHMIAEREEGWIQVMCSMINMIPLDNPFGPSAVTILCDDCPLPSRNAVIKVTELFELSAQRASMEEQDIQRDRNICIVMGCIAERLAGPASVAVLTKDTLDFLVTLLVLRREPCVVLFAMIALEKYGHTTENKIRITNRLAEEKENPLLVLEKLADSEDLIWRQVGFCSQWALDNLFLVEGRKLSYEIVDMSKINVIMHSRNVCEYLKISPNGLEVRSDAYSFESVRCTSQVDEGCWYFECTIVTPGVMQIGLATNESNYATHEGCGIGDDLYSLAYDGCRRLVWYKAQPMSVMTPHGWNAGDIFGCLLDITGREIIFSINGEELVSCTEMFKVVRTGFFVAASLMAFQQLLFNFGHQTFQFPPERPYASWNAHGVLSDEERKVIPKRAGLEELMTASLREDTCTLCFDNTACCVLEPCSHDGFCSVCAGQLKECPMCRGEIVNVRIEEI